MVFVTIRKGMPPENYLVLGKERNLLRSSSTKQSRFSFAHGIQNLMYIFEIVCLSVASFAIIFSHSEGYLFTLLIVSFVVQELLILIRSHLFIFALISSILGGGSEKAMAPHSSTLAWKIPWTEEPGGLQSMGSLRVGHD